MSSRHREAGHHLSLELAAKSREHDAMAPMAVSHFVFVDFENVPVVDLGLVEGREVRVFLLFGVKQKKLGLDLVRQIQRLGEQVELIEVGNAGRNALDLTLAWRLGGVAEHHPAAHFYIVSRDKDFDPLVAHIVGRGINISRHDGFSALPLWAPAGKKAAIGKLEQLIAQLEGANANRPKKRARLLRHIGAFYANKLSPEEIDAVAGQLIKRRVITIDAQDRVGYL